MNSAQENAMYVDIVNIFSQVTASSLHPAKASTSAWEVMSAKHRHLACPCFCVEFAQAFDMLMFMQFVVAPYGFRLTQRKRDA